MFKVTLACLYSECIHGLEVGGSSAHPSISLCVVHNTPGWIVKQVTGKQPVMLQSILS